MTKMRTRLLRRLLKQLPEPAKRALDVARSNASRGRGRLFLVGGGVRDLLMRLPVSDLDIVAEGSAIALARATGKAMRAPVKIHERFRTASVVAANLRVDFADARTEMYTSPGALPLVEPASLEEDLSRRDISINAMALELVGEKPGQIFDLHGGEQDIERKRIRMLHDESFQDDATRALRAVRYAGRLGFRIERTTAVALRRDRSYLDSISGTRVRHEFERIAGEPHAAEIIALAERYGLLESVHAELRSTGRSRGAIRRLAGVPAGHRDAVFFCALIAEANAGAAEEVIGRLAMTNRQAEAVVGYLAIRRDTSDGTGRSIGASRAVELFEPRPVSSVWAHALTGSASVAKAARRYLAEWRFVRTRLHGDDLVRLGVERGPKVGLALRALRAAKVDGSVVSREDEEAFVMRLIGSEGHGG